MICKHGRIPLLFDEELPSPFFLDETVSMENNCYYTHRHMYNTLLSYNVYVYVPECFPKRMGEILLPNEIQCYLHVCTVIQVPLCSTVWIHVHRIAGFFLVRLIFLLQV